MRGITGGTTGRKADLIEGDGEGGKVLTGKGAGESGRLKIFRKTKRETRNCGAELQGSDCCCAFFIWEEQGWILY